jgi:hypothetical protein
MRLRREIHIGDGYVFGPLGLRTRLSEQLASHPAEVAARWYRQLLQ